MTKPARNLPKERYAKTENRVACLRPEGEIDDPLTEILRSGARRLIAQAVEAEFDAFVAFMPPSRSPTGASASFGMGMIRFARSRPGSGRSKSKSPRPAIVGLRTPPRAFVFHRRSCRNGRGGRKAWTRFCRLFTCAGFRLATSTKC